RPDRIDEAIADDARRRFGNGRESRPAREVRKHFSQADHGYLDASHDRRRTRLVASNLTPMGRRTTPPRRGREDARVGVYLESLSAGMGSVAAVESGEAESAELSSAATGVSLVAAASVAAAVCVSSSARACVPMPIASSVSSINR